MIKSPIILLIIACLFRSGVILSQPVVRYNTFSYNVNEGLLQSTIGNFAFDRNNFCWISFPNGLQKFDGKNFINIPLQEGLPSIELCELFSASDGTLFISHRLGISRYDIKKNRFSLVWETEPNTKLSSKFIGQENEVLYIYTQRGHIIGISTANFSVVSNHPTGLPDFSDKPDFVPRPGREIINHKTALLINKSICIWDVKQGIFRFRSTPIEDISLYLLKMKSENEVVFYTYKPAGTLKIYNTVTNSVKLLPIRQAAGVQFARCTIFTWQKKLFINLNNRIYETDSSLQVLKSEVVNFQNQALSDLSSFSDVKEDGNGNLYVQTVSDGIKKVLFNTYPIRFYNQRQVNGNFIMSILPDKVNNRVFAGVYGNGLLIYDTLQRLVQHLRITNAGGELISPHTMLKTNSNQYLVFGSGEKFAWVLSQDLRLVKAIPIRPEHNRIRRGTEHFANVVWQNKDRAIVQSQSFAYKIDFSGNNITIREFYAADGYIMSGLFYPPYLITHGNNNLLLLDTASFIQKKKLAFENTAYVRCFATDASNKIYVGSNNGIFITDTSGQVLQHLNKKTGLADDCIYAMHFDESGHLWCSTNKGIFKIQKNRLVLQLRKEDGLQENEFNTNSFARSDDGELFFGGVNGISSFYPAAITINSKQPDLLFTAIRANGEEAVQDTAAWEVSSITMPYDRNALSFDFVAMGNYNPDQYIYQYRMDGVDQEWIQQDGMQTVRYSLRPGPYTFKIYASRSFDPHAAPMKEIRIIIHPPFWRSWWFNTLAAVGVLLLLTYFINQQNKRKYARQLQQHENERQLQQERVRISKDLHDSLGVYAHTVLYNAELLEKETSEKQRIKLVDDLKFVSKDIIVSLRETIWALAKETYPMEECFVRIRNFIQPLTRYYGSIVFKTEGEAPSSVVLPHANALNLVRIVQEAVSNSIKHASPSTITVSCKPRNGKWQVSIEDDGKGFDYTAVKERERGNGLNNIEQRSEASGFTLEIDSKENKGTRITITI